MDYVTPDNPTNWID